MKTSKQQFIALLTRLWSQKIITCEGSAYLLTSEEGHSTCRRDVLSLKAQETTDSWVILYCEYARSNHYSNVIVKSPDSDIFFILLHHAQTMTFILAQETRRGSTMSVEYLVAIPNSIWQHWKHFTSTIVVIPRVLSTGSQASQGCQSLQKFSPGWEKHGMFLRDLMDNLNELTCALCGKLFVQSLKKLKEWAVRQRWWASH